MKTQDTFGFGLLNDPIHSFDYVIELLVQVCGITPEQALAFAVQIDRQGQAIVFSGSRAECEEVFRQVQEYGPDPRIPSSTGPLVGYIEQNAKPSPTPSIPFQAPSQRPSDWSFKLFRLVGTDVYIHWSWFLVAFILIRDRPVVYSSPIWDVAAYVTGFGLVLLHELGHVLACRQVGGAADRVLLWPLGGLAFAMPPPRPGAHLWTTAAGPLVNLVLAPILFGLTFAAMPHEPHERLPDYVQFLREIAWFNALMLVFNVLPIFPLDGGRFLFALLWWGLGRSIGLSLASASGLILALAMAVAAIHYAQWWVLATAVFLGVGAYQGSCAARRLAPLDRAPRRIQYICPHCKLSPPAGRFWKCPRCGAMIDVFEPLWTCSECGSVFQFIACAECGNHAACASWAATPQASGQPYEVVEEE